jgi:hypothetical protein
MLCYSATRNLNLFMYKSLHSWRTNANG